MIIVFAHFNSPLPKHLILNLKRTIHFFPQQEIHLVTNLNSALIKINGLKVFKYSPSPRWFELEKALSHNREFRNNFWFTSLARFLALAEFSQTHNREMLHIESDVIISHDFPFDDFLEIPSLFSFPVVNKSMGIASCLFVKNTEAAEYLSQLTMLMAKKDSFVTDMHVLGEISKKDSDFFQLLPTSPSLKKALPSASESHLDSIHESTLLFKGFFDGRDLGMYLFGDDPRNKRGISFVRKFDARFYLNARKLIYILENDRDFPSVYDPFKMTFVPIFTLHIHSKNLKLFKLTSSRKVIKKAISDSKKRPQTKFYPTIFINSFTQAIKRRLIWFFRAE